MLLLKDKQSAVSNDSAEANPRLTLFTVDTGNTTPALEYRLELIMSCVDFFSNTSFFWRTPAKIWLRTLRSF
jgi:hypothetical protein